ncbi:hypothetical protein OAF73_00830 [Planctomycetota bacterium]|nr:hypothetical protein [Planctomycetota bacterium]
MPGTPERVCEPGRGSNFISSSNENLMHFGLVPQLHGHRRPH